MRRENMGVHRITENYGDDLLSSFERRLWDLTYYCLMKFSCPVMFNVYGPNAPLHIDQKITFFVPSDNPECEKVRAFLEDELKDEVRSSQLIESGGPCGDEHSEWFWGSTVDIREYSGPNFYLENLYSKPMIEEMTKKFLAQIDELQKKKINH
jgi:hypothetical protein